MKSSPFRLPLYQRTPTTLCLVFGLLALVLDATTAHADLADQHYKRALQYYESKDYSRSIREFQAAYKVRQLPRILLNIGQVYRKLGMASTALKFYEHYLRVEPHPKPEIKAEVDRYIAQTRAMLDPPEFVAVETKSASAVAAEMVASAPSNVSVGAGVELSTEDDDAPSQPQKPGKRGARVKLVTPLRPPEPLTQSPLPADQAGQNPYGKGPARPGLGLVPAPGSPGGEIPPAKPDAPFYKKGWFWGVIGGVAAGALITGVAVGVSRTDSPPATILYPVK